MTHKNKEKSMFFKKKKDKYPLIFDEKKGEIYLGEKKEKKKIYIANSTKLLLITIIVFLANYAYRN